MKKVKVSQSGKHYTALNNEDLVTKMRQDAFQDYEKNSDFMISYAKRSVIYADEDIRATDADSFVEDLIRLKHIQIIADFSQIN